MVGLVIRRISFGRRGVFAMKKAYLPRITRNTRINGRQSVKDLEETERPKENADEP
jgi:hypothetical protein